MARSQRLRLGEIRRIHDLAARVRAAGSHPRAWRTAALDGLIELLRAQVGLTVDVAGAEPGGDVRPIDPIDLGWTDESARRRYYQYYSSGEATSDPGTIALLERHRQARFATWSRGQHVDDRTWYASPTVSEARRTGDVDDFVCSTIALGGGVLHGFILYRPWNDRRFGPRDVRALRLFHAQLLRDCAAPLPYEANHLFPGAGDPAAELSHRLRQTLDLLLAGDGAKQIAHKLDLSAHTVKDYIKALYRRLNVSSRAELMSRYVARPKEGVLHLPDPPARDWRGDSC